MPNTGAKFPTLGASVSEAPWSDDTWVNPTNIYSDNATNAEVSATTFDAGDQTYVLKATGFDFSSIPDDAVIKGVVCVVNAYYATAVGSIDLLQLLDTSKAKVGTNQCATPVALGTSTSGTVTKGSATDLWGNALTPVWVKNSSFGVAIGCLAGGTGNNNVDVYVDYVTLTVYWDYALRTANTPFTLTFKDATGLVYDKSIHADLQTLWRFDDGSGNATDSSGNGNTGTLTGGPVYNSSAQIGLYCLVFDGTTKYVANTALSPNIPGDMSISFWVKFTTTALNLRMIELAQAAAIGVNIKTAGVAGKIAMDNSGGPTTEVTSAATYNDGNWHLVVVTRSGTTYTLYVDKNSQGTSGGTAPTYTKLYVGIQSDSTSPFNGSIDDVRIYNRVLTTANINTLFTYRSKILQAAVTAFTLTGIDANLTKVALKILVAQVGEFTLTSIATGLKADRKLGTAATTFNLTTVDVSALKVTRKLPTANTAFNLTGIDVNFKSVRRLVTANTAFDLVGQNLTALKVARYLRSANTEFSLVGINAILKATRKLPTAVTAFDLTSIATGLKADRKLNTTVTAFDLTSISTGLKYGRNLKTAVTAFDLVGINVGLKADRFLHTANVAFDLTGIDAAFKREYKLVTDVGAFNLTGIDVNLVYSAAGKRLIAIVGEFVLAGQNVNLKADRKLITANTELILTGQNIGLKANRKLVTAVRTFDLVGIDVNLVYAVPGRLVAAVTPFTFTGNDVILRVDRKLHTLVDAFDLVGQDAALKLERRLSTRVTEFDLIGLDVNLIRTGILPKDYRLYAPVVDFILTGNPVNLHIDHDWKPNIPRSRGWIRL